MDASLRFDYSNVVVEHEQAVTVLVRITAPPAPAFTTRKPLNLALVLDRSGSMAGEKIAHLQIAAAELVRQLTPQDRLAVVIFDSEVNTIIPPAPVTDKAAIWAAIRQITDRGMTNLSGGWLAGLSHVESGYDREALNRVLLLTDGQANEGVKEPEPLRAIGRSYLEKGISTTTLGFGTDFNETLLAGIADDAGGAFYFIATPDSAPAAFLEELGELLKTVGQNLTLEFRMAHPARFMAVLNQYPTEAVQQGLRVRVGDLFGSESREILAELWVPALRELGPRQIGEIEISLDQVVDPIGHHQTVLPIEVNIVRPEEAQTVADPEVQTPATILWLGELRDQIIPLLRAQRVAEAREKINASEKLLQSKGSIPPEIAAEIAKLRQLLEEAEAHLPEMNAKMAHYASYRARHGKGDYRK